MKGVRCYRMCCGPLSYARGVYLYWYRSSQKRRRDEQDRTERIERRIERLETLDLKRMKGPKTDAAIRKREILGQYRAEDRAKQAGLPAPKEKPAARPANVVNLMDALRRSIQESGGKEKAAKAGGRRAAAETAPAKKRTKKAS
jgi:hypothetical protein